MVDWFSPVELGRTGIRAVLAEVFGSYADKRELQAALHQSTDTPFTTPCARRVPECTEMWLDYVADVGDGFNTTFSVASLLSRDELEVEGVPQPTPRADVLVLGGDQVYPSATRDNYRDRMAGPYAAALPMVNGHIPVLFAIPGNHDWYDGLTSFTRQFCQRRTIGAWQTEQFRSYFAAKLIRNWWIWGIDIQLGTDIDYPQLRYFRDIAHQMEKDANARMAPDDPPLRVILVTAQPSWVASDATRGERPGVIGADPADFRALAFFLDEVIYCADEQRRRRIEVAVVLSGDLHHYAHYARSDEKPSLLPRHRGIAAIEWTIRERDPIAGGSIYHLAERMDAGPIAAQEWCFVRKGETARELWERALAPLGLNLIRKVVRYAKEHGHVPGTPQDEQFATRAPLREPVSAD